MIAEEQDCVMSNAEKYAVNKERMSDTAVQICILATSPLCSLQLQHWFVQYIWHSAIPHDCCLRFLSITRKPTKSYPMSRALFHFVFMLTFALKHIINCLLLDAPSHHYRAYILQIQQEKWTQFLFYCFL